MSFIGRERELKALTRFWKSERAGFIPIYGRRRVGKSELIVHFMDGKPGLYFTGKRAPAEAQLQEFAESAARLLTRPALAGIRPANWQAAFELVAENLPPGKKFILALDEFQWMAEASPELPSVLQQLWDRQWSGSGRILLILCGSYMGFMEREVLGKQSPLFGRRTGQILLQPFPFAEAARFHPRYSPADQARVYAICGGVPAYLLAFQDGQSVEQNIAAQLLDENSALAREPDFLLREELRELVPYHAILTALAEGMKSPTELAAASGVDQRGVGYYLQNLAGLGYVRQSLPLTGEKASKRSVRYLLDDPLLRFWFYFIFPHQSVLRFLGPERGLAEVIRPGLDAYFGRCFERLCREALPLLYAKENVHAAFEVGEYWDREVQIDVVGVRRDHWIDLGECKWKDTGSLRALAEELEAKVRRFPNPGNATVGRRLFVRSVKGAPARPPEGVKVHTLQDLYGLGAE